MPFANPVQPIADCMVACSQTAATGATLNPRTGEPYKRAPYKKASAELKAAAAQQRAEMKEAKTAAAAQLAAEKAANDKSELQRLKSEVARLTEALRAAEEKTEAAKKTAMLEASQSAAQQLLERYRDGLRDGASLTRGGFGNLRAATPDSSAAVGSSPSMF